MKFAVPALIVFGRACGFAPSVVTILLLKEFRECQSIKKDRGVISSVFSYVYAETNLNRQWG